MHAKALENAFGTPPACARPRTRRPIATLPLDLALPRDLASAEEAPQTIALDMVGVGCYRVVEIVVAATTEPDLTRANALVDERAEQLAQAATRVG